SRVFQHFALIVGAGHYAFLQGNDHAADRHFVLISGGLRFIERHLHVLDVKRMARVGQRQIEGGPIGHEMDFLLVFSFKIVDLTPRVRRLPLTRGVKSTIANSLLPLYGTPNCVNTKLQMSVCSSRVKPRGLPAPWPARVSWRSRIGAAEIDATCSRATILRACKGSTRLSDAAVVISMAG